MPVHLLPLTGLECLEQLDPIDDFAQLALQVAQLTAVVAMLREQVEFLQGYGKRD